MKHAGETELRLPSLCAWEETPYFTDKERITLKFSETLTKLSAQAIHDKDYNPLLAHYTKEEICYLSLAITQINTWNRLRKTFLFNPGNYQVAS